MFRYYFSLFFCTFVLHKKELKQSVCLLNSQLHDTYASVLLVHGSRASDFGLMKIDNKGKVISFSEKPKGADLKAMASFFLFFRFWCFFYGFLLNSALMNIDEYLILISLFRKWIPLCWGCLEKRQRRNLTLLQWEFMYLRRKNF